MNVLLPLVTSTAGLSGVQRHALNLTACLLEQEDIGLHLVIAPWQQHLLTSYGLRHPRLRIHVADVPTNMIGRNGWFYAGLPRLASRIKADVVHAIYPIPIHGGSLDAPLVVTLHDLYPFEIPQNFGRAKAALHRSIVRHCLKCAEAIICVSHATARSASNFFSPNICEKIAVIYNCIIRPIADVKAPDILHDGAPFLLAVAQHRHNKNLLLLLRAFARLLTDSSIPNRLSVVIVGMQGPQTRDIERLISELRLSGRVLLLQGLSEAELSWCYQNCSAVVVPSIAEGFCLPAAEALLAGSPLICSDIPVLREVVGSERCTFVPLGTEAENSFARAIEASFQSPRPHPVNLPHYSQQAIASHCLALYKRVVSKSAPENLGQRGPVPREGHVQI